MNDSNELNRLDTIESLLRDLMYGPICLECHGEGVVTREDPPDSGKMVTYICHWCSGCGRRKQDVPLILPRTTKAEALMVELQDEARGRKSPKVSA